MTAPSGPALGAIVYGDDRCRFRVWAPAARQVTLHLLTPTDRTISLRPELGGYQIGRAHV